MIQKIVSVKDPTLRIPSKNITRFDKKTYKLINDLKDTLVIQNDPVGVGLAAPQIGKNLRVFAIKPDATVKIIANPEIISVAKEAKDLIDHDTKLMEGCLSLPNLYGPLKRPSTVKINYLDDKGEKVTKLFSGFEAQIILHEIDHLNGILFIDRLLEQKKPLYELVNGEWEKVEI
ncbi:MAG: Peptide deformylase [Candidatus Woesebacteria bacterium GW2011_GWA1_39_21]|uniref:Peptide deformylase n=1 Tax=Candidatus Woesebacteria bacterium GW2011_GWA1_39_21 TaxID=1618550 RepID=A0A0G0NCN8_9BACT|nr:MAG: Peptide deformylase [Candidatus Woesebacteria bacterium GW2011_GWA1_39_21]